MEEKVFVTLEMKQFCQAIEKANELVDALNKAKTLTRDLAYMIETLNFKPVVTDAPEDVQ